MPSFQGSGLSPASSNPLTFCPVRPGPCVCVFPGCSPLPAENRFFASKLQQWMGLGDTAPFQKGDGEEAEWAQILSKSETTGHVPGGFSREGLRLHALSPAPSGLSLELSGFVACLLPMEPQK